jgi:hypothetical protein
VQDNAFAEQVEAGAAVHLAFDHLDLSVESGLSLLPVFALPRVDDRQMIISLGRAQSGNEDEAGAWKRWYVHFLSPPDQDQLPEPL